MVTRLLTNAMCLALLPLCLIGCGQVTRQMTLKSEPTGALVYLNGQEVGRTPCTVDFVWYGRYDVTLRHEGSQSLKTVQNVPAPWWQWIPLDFACDILPGRKVDQHEYSYVLKPQSDAPVAGPVLVDRAASLRPMLESGEFTRKPSTRPVSRASKPATRPEPEVVEPSVEPSGD